jgi:hypothetical protein
MANVINVMADGSIKENIEGTVITNEQFYNVFNEIIKSRCNKCREK